MLRKVLIFVIVITVFLFFQRSWFSLIGIAVTILLSYEQVLRARFWSLNLASSTGHLRSRLSNLPYSEESYNTDFLACFPSKKHDLRKTFFHNKLNFTSSLLNFVDGLRKTSFVESDRTFENRIFLFGGSTIDCQEVPDDYTIASRLQKILNSANTVESKTINSNLRAFKVINCGVSGASLNANYEHFQELAFSKGDICIFYFGINESNFGKTFFVFKSPLTKIPEINRLRTRKLNNVILLQRFIRLLSTFDRNHIIFNEKVNKVSQILTSLERSCTERGIELIAILQPFVNTRSPISHHDRGAFFHYWPRSHFNAHTLLFERFADEFRNENFFVDGRTIFDGIDLDVYTEWCHTNYLGNQIIAENFYKIILDRISKD